jgi:hypothetical protein
MFGCGGDDLFGVSVLAAEIEGETGIHEPVELEDHQFVLGRDGVLARDGF